MTSDLFQDGRPSEGPGLDQLFPTILDPLQSPKLGPDVPPVGLQRRQASHRVAGPRVEDR